MVHDTISVDEALDRCAVCGTSDIRPWFATEFGSIGRCGHCRQVLRADHPHRNGQVELHQTSNLHEVPYAVLGDKVTDELFFYQRFLDLCQDKLSGGRILDVGCGAGEFLKLADDRGFDVAGIEPIAELRAIAQLKLGNRHIDSLPVEEADFQDASIDAVAMWDVIEHLVDPKGALDRLCRLLKSGGYLGIATLNHASLMYKIYHTLRICAPRFARPFGKMLYNPFHSYYFDKATLVKLVENAGFTVVEHRGYEFPIRRLDVSRPLKIGMQCLYWVQHICQMEGEQYLFARKR